MSFTPSVEDFDLPEGTAFITEHPRELMQKKLFNPVPWLVGVTSHDGLPHSLSNFFCIIYFFSDFYIFKFATDLLLFGGIAADLNNEFEKYAPYYFELEGDLENAIEAAKFIKEFYFKDAGIGMGSQAQLADVYNMTLMCGCKNLIFHFTDAHRLLLFYISGQECGLPCDGRRTPCLRVSLFLPEQA